MSQIKKILRDFAALLILGAVSAHVSATENLIPEAVFSEVSWVSDAGFQACSGDTGINPCIYNAGELVLSYLNATISRSFAVDAPLFNATFAVQVRGGQPNYADAFSVQLNAFDADDQLLQTQSVSGAASDTEQTVTVMLAGTFTTATRVEVRVSGSSAESWAGNYGSVFSVPSLFINNATANLWIKKLTTKVNSGIDDDSWTAQYLYNADRRNGHNFNPASDALDLTLAGSNIHLPAGSLVSKGQGFAYSSAKGEVPAVKVSLLPSAQTLTVSVAGTNLGVELPVMAEDNTVQLGDEQQNLQIALDAKGKFLPTASYKSPALVVATASVKDSGTVKDSLALSLNLADPALLSVYDFNTPCPTENKNCKQPDVAITLYDKNGAVLLSKDLTELLASTRKIAGEAAFYTMKKVVKTDPSESNILSAFSFASKTGALKITLKNLVLNEFLDSVQSQLGVAITIDGKTYFTSVTLFETAENSNSWSSKISKFAALAPMP